MKFATIVLLGVLLLASFPSMLADEKAADPAGAGQVALAYTNGGSSTGDICIWYPLLLGDLKLESLFSDQSNVDKEHAYLIWVSDYIGVEVPTPLGSDFTLYLIPTGTGTIYFTQHPENRIWTDLEHNDRTSWGLPVAKFVRKAGIFQSLNGGYSGTMINTAELVSSQPFRLNGKMFNFRDLIPHGMTCFETASGAEENGTCIANGGGK